MHNKGWHQNRGILGGFTEAGDRSDCIPFFLWPEKLLNQSDTVVSRILTCSLSESRGVFFFYFFLCYFLTFWFVWNVSFDDAWRPDWWHTSLKRIFVSASFQSCRHHLHKAPLYVPDSDSAAWHTWVVFTIPVCVDIFRQQFKVCSPCQCTRVSNRGFWLWLMSSIFPFISDICSTHWCSPSIWSGTCSYLLKLYTACCCPPRANNCFLSRWLPVMWEDPTTKTGNMSN